MLTPHHRDLLLRFSTPSARIVFSKVALITNHDGQRVLLLRMANERSTAIVEATFTCT